MIGKQAEGVEFYAEPMIGFRTWRVRDLEDLGPSLLGCIYTARWPEGPDMVARCLHRNAEKKHKPGQVPVKNCDCGLYGYWDYKGVQDYGHFGSYLELVRGVVIGWGKGWRAQHGFRTKRARPVAFLRWPERRANPRDIFDPSSLAAEKAAQMNELIEEVAERYGVIMVDSPNELLDAGLAYVRAGQ
jgi:hypothetical protein